MPSVLRVLFLLSLTLYNVMAVPIALCLRERSPYTDLFLTLESSAASIKKSNSQVSSSLDDNFKPLLNYSEVMLIPCSLSPDYDVDVRGDLRYSKMTVFVDPDVSSFVQKLVSELNTTVVSSSLSVSFMWYNRSMDSNPFEKLDPSIYARNPLRTLMIKTELDDIPNVFLPDMYFFFSPVFRFALERLPRYLQSTLLYTPSSSSELLRDLLVYRGNVGAILSASAVVTHVLNLASYESVRRGLTMGREDVQLYLYRAQMEWDSLASYLRNDLSTSSAFSVPSGTTWHILADSDSLLPQFPSLISPHGRLTQRHYMLPVNFQQLLSPIEYDCPRGSAPEDGRQVSLHTWLDQAHSYGIVGRGLSLGHSRMFKDVDFQPAPFYKANWRADAASAWATGRGSGAGSRVRPQVPGFPIDKLEQARWDFFGSFGATYTPDVDISWVDSRRGDDVPAFHYDRGLTEEELRQEKKTGIASKNRVDESDPKNRCTVGARTARMVASGTPISQFLCNRLGRLATRSDTGSLKNWYSNSASTLATILNGQESLPAVAAAAVLSSRPSLAPLAPLSQPLGAARFQNGPLECGLNSTKFKDSVNGVYPRLRVVSCSLYHMKSFFPLDLAPVAVPGCPSVPTYVFGTTEAATLSEPLWSYQALGLPGFGSNSSLARLVGPFASLSSSVMLIAPSNWARRGFIKAGVPPHKIRLLPHAIDTDVFTPAFPLDQCMLVRDYSAFQADGRLGRQTALGNPDLDSVQIPVGGPEDEDSSVEVQLLNETLDGAEDESDGSEDGREVKFKSYEERKKMRANSDDARVKRKPVFKEHEPCCEDFRACFQRHRSGAWNMLSGRHGSLATDGPLPTDISRLPGGRPAPVFGNISMWTGSQPHAEHELGSGATAQRRCLTIASVAYLRWNKGPDVLLSGVLRAAAKMADERVSRGARLAPSCVRLILKGNDAVEPSARALRTWLKDPRTAMPQGYGRFSGMDGWTAANALREEGRLELMLIGSSTSDEVINMIYRASDIYVAPYRAEGFALPVFEAAAAGLPSLTTQLQLFDHPFGSDPVKFSEGEESMVAKSPLDILWEDTEFVLVNNSFALDRGTGRSGLGLRNFRKPQRGVPPTSEFTDPSFSLPIKATRVSLSDQDKSAERLGMTDGEHFEADPTHLAQMLLALALQKEELLDDGEYRPPVADSPLVKALRALVDKGWLRDAPLNAFRFIRHFNGGAHWHIVAQKVQQMVAIDQRFAQ